MLMGLHLAYITDGVSFAIYPLVMLPYWSGRMHNFPHHYLTIYQYVLLIVLPFKSPETIEVSYLLDLPFALTGHNLPWDLSDLWYNLRSFYCRPHADTPNLPLACLIVPHET